MYTPVSINNLSKIPVSSSRSMFDDIIGTNSSDLSPKEIFNLRPLVYRILSDSTSDLIYLKTHDSWGLNSNNKEIFPKEITFGVIYIIRNPLDVAISFAHHNTESISTTVEKMNNSDLCLSNNPIKLSYQLKQKLLSWSEHVQSWIDKSHLPIHIVKYEDMLDNPVKTFSLAAKFLKIESTESEIEKATRNSDFNIVKSQELRFGFQEKPIKAEGFFRSGTSNNWKNQSEKQVFKPLIEHNYDLMERFGYLP